MRKIVLLLLTALLLLTGCGTVAREYREDLVFQLSEQERLIIKEWSFLMGSGAEIYYQQSEQELVLLGQTSGGDDGACPFSEDAYEITRNGNSVTIKWRFRAEIWRSKIFELPV